MYKKILEDGSIVNVDKLTKKEKESLNISGDHEVLESKIKELELRIKKLESK